MDGCVPAPTLVEGVRAAGQVHAVKQRSFLFLQGPISDFFDRLGRALIARGHRVHRVNLNLGDQLFWRLPATHFRGRLGDWRGFIAELLDEHEITDIVLLGDRRPHHLIAAEEARARGIAVIATELGYARPDWLTLEFDGNSTYSRFPRDPDAIRELAKDYPAPDFEPRFRTRFWLTASLDIAYNVALVLGRPLYPHYRWHGIYHPYVEYLGWIYTLTRGIFTGPGNAAGKARLQVARAGSYFVYPLQLATDYQIRAHSPYADGRDALRQVIASFAASGCPQRLAIFIHPLDNGLIRWRRLAMDHARELGIGDRVLVFDDGITPGILEKAAGVVTINSTVGVTALRHGIPVKVLGNAVFDVPGLTHQGSLDAFWRDPSLPDRVLLDDFMRALVGTTQVKGGYYEADAKARAVEGFVARLEQGLPHLPPLAADDFATRLVRPMTHSIAIVGAADPIGAALARIYAEPGVALCLVGDYPQQLAALADDCRRRGAVVETAAGGDRLAAFDRRAPVDTIIAVGAAAADAPHGSGPVGALAARLRQRRCGRLVLVSAAPSGAIHPGSAAWRGAEADGVGISLVRRGHFARRGGPGMFGVSDDRAAQLILTGIERGRRTIALPGPLGTMLHALRYIPLWLGGKLRRALAGDTRRAAPPADERTLPGKLGTRL